MTHARRTAWLLAESFGVFAALLAVGVAYRDVPAVVATVAVLQGCWLHRLYLAGHEAVHRKMARNKRVNDVLGQALLLPILVPLGAYRKIHLWHHGHNRRDVHTAALDTWVVPQGSVIGRAVAYVAFYTSVFAGGFFVHSLVTLALLLALPVKVARKVHPAYRGWKGSDRLQAIVAFGLGISLHVAVAAAFGPWAWAASLGLPFAVFAVIYSWFAYMFHYRTGFGSNVKEHVRSLRPNPVWRWWLLHFNEHATHHADPSLPWYELPNHRIDPDPAVPDVARAVLHQLKGPIVVDR